MSVRYRLFRQSSGTLVVPLENRRSLLARMRQKRLWLRAIAVIVAGAVLNLYLQPLALAAQLPPRPAPAIVSNEARLSEMLDTLKTRLGRLEAKLEQHEDVRRERGELKTLRQDLDALDAGALTDFDAIERHIRDKNLPAVILERHKQAVRTYKQEMAALKADLGAVENAKDDSDRHAKARTAKAHLLAKQKKREPRTKFDPNDLPNKSLRPNPTNKPRLDRASFIRAGLTDNPTVKLAANGSFRIDQLPGASDPAYLAETTEVVLTDAIRAKAAELEHNPVKIYNWVRSNVEWVPTWGATQDADVTLGSLHGNAMDISSLLIALLRASDIPARYVHGAIELRIDKFMNWAGGFTDVNAALNYASSGGIPITSVVSGGRVTKVRLEHVWVEAAVDFYPSRGAINNSADTWVPLDASYKEYEDLRGLDVVAIAGIDSNGLVQSFANSGAGNQAEGWVSGLNLAILQSAQTQAQTTLETYINTNLSNPTMGEVLGGRRVVAVNASVLPPVLPNRLLVIGARYGQLPAGLQDTMTFAFGVDPIGEFVEPVTYPWSRLNNHKVILSFKPASAADEQALASLLPAGSITDPSQIPTSIPAYLIYVVPQISVDGQVVGQGNAMRLGEDLNFIYYVNRISGGSHSYSYAVTAGSYLAVAVAGGSVSKLRIDALRMKRQQTEATLKSGDAAAITALTREDIMGDTFYAGTLGYFSQYIALANITCQSQQARQSLPYAYGTVGYEPHVQTLFGLPRAINPGGAGVNVRLAWNVQPFDGDNAKRIALARHVGVISSALEHAVLEQMFSSRTHQGQGVSAAKALQIAAQQGQRIYHITSANAAQALPNLRLDSLALSEINQALAAGREVIAHTDRISVGRFTGEGYVLFDPATGDGAYKITGGTNGGEFDDFLDEMTLLLTVFSFLAAIAAFALIGVGLGAAVLLVLSDILAYVGVALTVWYVFNETGSVTATVAAGVVALLAALYISAVVGALVWSIALGTTILAAIAFLYVVTVIVSAILFLLIWLLTHTASLPRWMQRQYAYVEGAQRLGVEKMLTASRWMLPSEADSAVTMAA